MSVPPEGMGPGLGAAMGGSAGGVAVGPPRTPEELEQRKQGFRAFFQTPEVRAFALQMGINLLQPNSIADTTASAVGRAVGAGAEAAGRVDQQRFEREQAAQQQEFEGRRVAADEQRAGAAVEGVQVQREGIQSSERTAGQQIESQEAIAAGRNQTARDTAAIGAESRLAAARIGADAQFDQQVLRNSAERELARIERETRESVARINAAGNNSAAAVQNRAHLAQAIMATNPGISQGEAEIRAEDLLQQPDRLKALAALRGDLIFASNDDPLKQQIDRLIQNILGPAESGTAGRGTGSSGASEQLATQFRQMTGREPVAVRSAGGIHMIQGDDGQFYIVKQGRDGKLEFANAGQ